MSPSSRRSIHALLVIIIALGFAAGCQSGRPTKTQPVRVWDFGYLGKRFPSERFIERDAVTGAEMVVLTNGLQSDAKIYQTHPQWTSDGKWIVFHGSGRSAGSQAYAVNETTGDIVQLTQGAGNGTGGLCVARKSMKLYFPRNKNLAEKGLPKTPPPEWIAATQAATQPAPRATSQPTSRPTDRPNDRPWRNRGPGSRPASGPASAPTSRPFDPDAVFQIIEVDLDKLLKDSASNQLKPATAYERICATLPKGLVSAGGFALDANEDVAYISVIGTDVGSHLPAGVKPWPTPEGARMGAGPAGLRAINLATGEVKVVIDTPFQIGHVQTNPWMPGEIIYCYETGGDATQRIWTTRADGSGNRPLFVEEKDDWVTHEAVVTPDEVMFNLIGHQARLRKRPTGIAVINLRTDAVELLGQVTERDSRPELPPQNAQGERGYGGFWHCNGSEDGQWAVGDTFAGNLYVINRKTGQRTLLTTDHKMKPDHTHPTFAPAGDRVLIQSGHFTQGARLSLVVVKIPDSLLRDSVRK